MVCSSERQAAQSIPSAVLDCARLPIAVMIGAENIFEYVNPAFCTLVGRTPKEMLGRAFSALIPDERKCRLRLDRVFRTGKCETYMEHFQDTSDTLFWSYEMWPTWAEASVGPPTGVVLEIMETGPLHRNAVVMNEALLLSAVRQHELMEEAEELNNKLRAEIKERQRAELAVEQMAFYDALTNLPNRRLLMDRLHQATLASGRTRHHGALLFIDLDRFKSLNDTQGHHVGDLLLQQVAQRLKHSVREDDTVARLGGDEFVVMLADLSEDASVANAQARSIGGKVLASLNQTYLLVGQQHHCSGSIGITLFGKSKDSVEDLLKRADVAQYRAKSAGGSTICFFDPAMQLLATERAALQADLRIAVQEEQLRLHYQPQVDGKGVLRGVEALLRWEHPERGLLSPSDFIVSAEEQGIIGAIGMWVVKKACTQLVTWSHEAETSHLTIAINVSAGEFGHVDFAQRVLEMIERSGANPGQLILEFTERIMFGPLEETLAKMIFLKAGGLCFAMDDFGVGYSSLACLKLLPLSQVKIDRSFISDVVTSVSGATIASAVIALGQSLGLEVIAEGVETEEQRTFLSEHGCRMYQGFLFGRPQAIEVLNAHIRNGFPPVR